MMKRELAALAVLIVLISTSIWNIRQISNVTGEMQIALCKARTATEQLNFKNSRRFAEEGLRIWQESHDYARIFLSQTQVDETTEAFYLLLEKLNEEDIPSISPAFDYLQYKIDSISSSERLSVGSIF